MYMPERPEWFKPLVKKYTNVKLPSFFKFAKDKDENQLADINSSFVNKLYKKIPNTPINTRKMGLCKLDYKKLMSNPNIVCTDVVANLYLQLSKEYRYMINMKDEYSDNLHYVACKIRGAFSALGYSDEVVADMLVSFLFGENKRHKQLLWFCYGRHIVNNLTHNISIKKTKAIQCVECGEWFDVDVKDNRTCKCDACAKIHNRELRRLQTQRYRENKKCSRYQT